MLTIAVGAYLAGRFMDWGASAHEVARWAGLLMLLPAAGWAWAMKLWSGAERPGQPATKVHEGIPGNQLPDP